MLPRIGPLSAAQLRSVFPKVRTSRGKDALMNKITKTNLRLLAAALALLSLAFVSAWAGTHNKSSQKKEKEVYVCACLKTMSCSCMTEAKMKGPCACGTEGGPPMKAVPANSDWAKHNRAELAK
jgi:hypothetical protein